MVDTSNRGSDPGPVETPDSILWFDYETFGLSPVWDRPAQFACLRTDLALEPIEPPRILWCRPPCDYLPDPEACLVTGQSPLALLREGLPEPRFIDQVIDELGRPGTCFTGYNNLRFDDEVTRHTLFRNFHDAYAHEWRHGNSRWDLLDVVRLARALRPEGIRWPVKADDRPSNRLEDLARANGLGHAHAHDALSDVYATLAVARLLRTHQPRLYDYAFANRSKSRLQRALDLAHPRIQLLVSGRVPAERGHVALILPLVAHPTNRNAVIVLDLCRHPSCLSGLSADQIRQRLFHRATKSGTSGTSIPDASPSRHDVTATSWAADERLPLISLALNKCPVVVPLNTLRTDDAQRLGIDIEQQTYHAQACSELIGANGRQAISDAFCASAPSPACTDVEGSLYSGPWFSEADRQRFARLRRATPDELVGMTGQFDDGRCDELLFRYRARHFARTLTSAERARWQAQGLARLGDDDAPWLSWTSFQDKLQAIDWEGSGQRGLRDDLMRYAKQLHTALIEPADSHGRSFNSGVDHRRR